MFNVVRQSIPRTPRRGWLLWFTTASLVVAALLVACNSKPPAEQDVWIGEVARPDGRAAAKACGLDVANTEIDLGVLDWNAEAKGVFSLTNITTSPMKISLGAATCSCLRVDLEPKDALLQPGQKGVLTVYLNTKDRTGAGKTEGCITVGNNAGETTLQLCVSGHLEGVSPPEKYVIRPRHLRSGKVPDIEFGIFTRSATAKVEVRSVSCHMYSPDLSPLPNQQSGITPPQPPASEWPSFPGVSAQIARMTIGEPSYLPAQRCYSRTVRVPVTCSQATGPASGRVVVRYLLGGDEKVTDFPFLLLSSE
jgi:hypothetical protein